MHCSAERGRRGCRRDPRTEALRRQGGCCRHSRSGWRRVRRRLFQPDARAGRRRSGRCETRPWLSGAGGVAPARLGRYPTHPSACARPVRCGGRRGPFSCRVHAHCLPAPAARLRTGFSQPASERVSPSPPQNGFLPARLRTGFSGPAPASVGTGPPRTGPPRGSRAGAARLERADEVWRRRALCRVRVAAAALALTGWGGRCAVRHVTVQLAEPADRGRRVGRAWSVVPD